jgi:hypothetical protein
MGDIADYRIVNTGSLDSVHADVDGILKKRLRF